ncbi:3-hydroxyacyl-CoA dehydrogenase family protein [Alkalibaculum sp. M08DMB]|uniref:3-hydroxyacyl-CoA dehydrogenase family protein n=1 Tax=Alkalibaculum sporogenes TaxID=2655001 RepID=A0A6A7K5Q6_9FIRM|nr:3-hydroxyacyl-CoA dehydrogenase NAD-binding domain-containing protein [Alkalibaculum sporogenes]MPW24715.1 3-hydroxyacyl-CoA dehydrogenase family protein [Alkalibaculum sporogenes]
MTHKIDNIAIFGSGLMGSGIAQIFAVAGKKVKISSRNPETSTALQNIEHNLTVMADNGAFDKANIQAVLDNIEISQDMEYVVKDADLIIENIPENMELKQNLFKQLDEICDPKTILASNTSVMSITEIGSLCKNRGRIVGTHFWNPPFLIPLVEIVRTEFTSDEVVESVYDVLKFAGKKPVRVNKDVPGFLANRLQHALWREAISIVENGIADAKTVDESIKYGFGLRLPQLSPMENADMVGTDLALSIHTYLLKHLENSTEPSPLLKEKVEKGDLGFKTGKGFQEWTPEEMQESRDNLLKYLIKVTK